MDTKSDKLKKIAKTTGKAVLTLLCPPVGLTTFVKSANEKATAIMSGVALSGAVTVGTFFYHSEKIYNYQPQESKESITIDKNLESDNIYVSTLLGVTSPLGFYASSLPTISLKTGSGIEYTTKGSDTITFQPETKQYVLNFGTDREFKGKNEYVSLAEAKKSLDKCLANGDLFGARKARDKYQLVSGEYNQATNAYSKAVAMINTELKSMSKIGQGDKK